jgi:hypothetical protein
MEELDVFNEFKKHIGKFITITYTSDQYNRSRGKKRKSNEPIN